MLIQEKIGEIRDLIERNEKFLSPATLLFGFVIDTLTLTRADLWLDNVILLSYLVIAGIAILLINADQAGRISNLMARKLILWLPLALQFAFGGLFSGFVVLYSRSASLIASWPFILILAFLLVGNEFFRKRYDRLNFQFGIYFIAILSYLIFAVPVLLDRIGPWIFVLSTVVGLAVIMLVILALKKISAEHFRSRRRDIWALTLAVLIGFNLLYFSNIMPPIPLALKEIVIAHGVARSGADFLVSYEPRRWYHFFRSYNPVFQRVGNQPVYAFSVIYAPTNLRTTIVHEWSYLDETGRKWIPVSNLKFGIFGGRERGFRGYSLKTQLQPGKWRVATKTAYGQTLGLTTFTLVAADHPPTIVTENK